MEELPIETLRDETVSALSSSPVVITAPTASGKSTQVPRWCSREGRVLVVEPRRVACRSLAVRVADLEGCRPGDDVGYSVRDDHRAGDATRVTFATPGVVLRMMEEERGPGGPVLSDFHTLILDEFHERRLDVDLILALAMVRFEGRLCVMSATMDGDRVADHLGGRHLHAEGRVYPVAMRHLPGSVMLPDIRGVEDRVLTALESASEERGNVLVFLPGKGEISDLSRVIRERTDLDVLELHGGLSLKEQSLAFEETARRRVILATNVAETSITLPGIGVVIDSGLVRQTRYHNDRGFLTLVPVAMDSADQRAGRAGRLESGICIRLWSESARLEPVTTPEVHRESLVPLVMASAACGANPSDLPFLDRPRDHALATAQEDLHALGVLDGSADITERGRRIFGLPLDTPLGRLLVEAESKSEDCLRDAIDLVSVLAVGRPLFRSDRRPPDREDDLRSSGDDASAMIRAVRTGRPERHGLARFTLMEARSIRNRLLGAWGLESQNERTGKIDIRRLARTAMSADPRCVYVARRRRGRVSWSNGGPEMELARESAIDGDKTEAIAVLDTWALGLGSRKTRVLITCAVPLPIPWLAATGLGRERIAGVTFKGGRVLARMERVYARKVVAVNEGPPQGRLAREAIRDLFLRGSIFKETVKPTRDRLEAAALYQRLQDSGRIGAEDFHGSESPWPSDSAIPSIDDWVMGRLETLGVESGEDIELLTPDDLMPPRLPEPIRERLDREFPRTVSVGDARYRVDYDLPARSVVLHKIAGQRKTPPPLDYLPGFKGFDIFLMDRQRKVTLKKH